MRPLTPLLLCALLLSTGCPGSVGADCELDTECAEGLICFAEICQELGTPEGTITFEVIPQPGTGLHPTTFAMGEQPLRFDLCGPSGVRGNTAAGTEVVAVGTVAGLPGQERRTQQSVGGAFFLPLSPGTWSLTFLLPADESGELPPPERLQVELSRCRIEELGEVAPGGEVRHARFDVVIDAERDPRPRCGVRAQLFDPLTGEPLSRALPIEREAGRTCVAPAEGRILAFHPPAGGGEIELRLTPTSTTWPTFPEKAFRFALPEAPLVDLGAVGIGAEANLERVELLVLAPDGAPVSGARIRAIGSSADGREHFAPPLATELGDGRYELWLAPATYLLRVEPPAGLDAAVGGCIEEEADACAEALVVEPGVPAQRTVRLARSLILSGRILTPERDPLPGARVLALPLGEGRRAATVSGAGGRYQLLLDPDRYELVVQPEPIYGAWRRYELQAPLVADGWRDLELPAAARVVGTVVSTARDGREERLHRAMVRAWRVEEGKAPQLVGEGFTDAAGRFGLELPAAP